MQLRPTACRLACVLVAGGLSSPAPAFAGVLPEDRVDAMFHYYDGGGVTIDGPSLLIRKKFAEKYAVNASYYVDMVSSASIDVITTASPYKEERTQYGLGFEYLRGKVTYTASFSNSKENDYNADTTSFTISQDMFGDLTTVQLLFSRGKDDVTRRDSDEFREKVDRHIYGIDVSQIVTKKLILGASWETTAEEGFLNNPYRRVRFCTDVQCLSYNKIKEFERYPHTRTGNALGLRGRYYLPYRAAVQGDYRWYNDTWGITANTFEVSYTQPIGDRLMFDAHFRYYMQNAADFYSDLFPYENFQNFEARDKELSTMNSQTLGFGVGYEFTIPRLKYAQKLSANLKYDFMQFKYDDFRDLRATGSAPGTEPLYSFNANVIRLFISGWF
jgi:hypothetical protein